MYNVALLYQLDEDTSGNVLRRSLLTYKLNELDLDRLKAAFRAGTTWYSFTIGPNDEAIVNLTLVRSIHITKLIEEPVA